MFSTADLCDSYRDEISVLNTPLNSYGVGRYFFWGGCNSKVK